MDAWVGIFTVVKTGAEGDGQSADVMEINTPGDLSEIAHLGLGLVERSCCWRGSNSRSSPLMPEPTPVSGRIVDAAAAFVR